MSVLISILYWARGINFLKDGFGNKLEAPALWREIINPLRGDPQFATCVALIIWFLNHSWQQSLILALGLPLCTVWGWSFSAIHGRLDGKIKFPPAYYLTNVIYGEHKAGDRIWGLIHSTIRGFPYLILFGVLDYFGFNHWWAGFAGLTMGAVQYVIGSFGENKYSADIYALIFGLILGIAIVYG